MAFHCRCGCLERECSYPVCCSGTKDSAVHLNTQDKARQIANIIRGIDTDYRGNFLLEIGKHLQMEAQGYTGKVLIRAAHDYGINNETQQINEGVAKGLGLKGIVPGYSGKMYGADNTGTPVCIDYRDPAIQQEMIKRLHAEGDIHIYGNPEAAFIDAGAIDFSVKGESIEVAIALAFMEMAKDV